MGASSGRSVVRSRGKRDSAQLEEARVVGGCGTGPCRAAVHDVCRGEACAEDSRTGRRAAQWRDRRTFTRRMQHATRNTQHATAAPLRSAAHPLPLIATRSLARHAATSPPACLPLVWSRAGRGAAGRGAPASCRLGARDGPSPPPRPSADHTNCGSYSCRATAKRLTTASRSCGGSQRGPTGWRRKEGSELVPGRSVPTWRRSNVEALNAHHRLSDQGGTQRLGAIGRTAIGAAAAAIVRSPRAATATKPISPRQRRGAARYSQHPIEAVQDVLVSQVPTNPVGHTWLCAICEVVVCMPPVMLWCVRRL